MSSSDPMHYEAVGEEPEVWGSWREGPYSALWRGPQGRWVLSTQDRRLRTGSIDRIAGKPFRRVTGVVQQLQVHQYAYRWIARTARWIWWHSAGRRGAGT